MIYRGWVIKEIREGEYFITRTGEGAGNFKSEDDAMAYVDEVLRKRFKKGLDAAREAGA